MASAPVARREAWSCRQCTYLNEGGGVSCEMCASPQFPPSRSLETVPTGRRGRSRSGSGTRLPPAVAFAPQRMNVRSMTGQQPGLITGRDDPTALPSWEQNASDGSCACIVLGAVTGAFFGAMIPLLCSDVEDVDMGSLIGLIIGTVVGLAMARCQRGENQRRRELEEIRRPWLNVDDPNIEAGPHVDISVLRVLAAAEAARMRHQLRQGLQMDAAEEATMPAHNTSIQALPTHRLSAQEIASASEENRSCRICIDDFKRGDEQRTLPCFHRFHKRCIDKWLRQSGTCPICKTRVDERAGP